jgi:hypothetical protein
MSYGSFQFGGEALVSILLAGKACEYRSRGAVSPASIESMATSHEGASGFHVAAEIHVPAAGTSRRLEPRQGLVSETEI